MNTNLEEKIDVERILYFACRDGNLDIIKQLATEKHVHKYSVGAAAANNHFEIVEWIHENIMPISHKEMSTIPMDNAAANGHLEMVKWLHENNAKCSHSAIDNAADNGHFEMVKWLLENRITRPRLAIYWATQKNHTEIRDWLLKYANSYI